MKEKINELENIIRLQNSIIAGANLDKNAMWQSQVRSVNAMWNEYKSKERGNG